MTASEWVMRTVGAAAAWFMFWTWLSLAVRAWADGMWIKDGILYRPEGARLVWTDTGIALLSGDPDYAEDDNMVLELECFLRLRAPWSRRRTWIAYVPLGTTVLLARGFIALEVDVRPPHTRLGLVEIDPNEPPRPPKPPRGGGLKIPAFPTFGGFRPAF